MQVHDEWRCAAAPLMTRWAKQVSPRNVLPEYPRPQLARGRWLNLNGLWDYAIAPREITQPPQNYDGKVLVPFPIESALSGVKKAVTENHRLWYRRTIEIPEGWRNERVLIHFGAVDWQSAVYVNGRQVGAHLGGYDRFSFDITDALEPGGEQELIVAAFDPTNASFQPRGKQVQSPTAIWHTPTSGIWQTVWLEPVSTTSIQDVQLIPDIDAGLLHVTVSVRGPKSGVRVEAVALDGEKIVGRGSGRPSESFTVRIRELKLWSPDAPHLYDLKLVLQKDRDVLDEATSYFGMRKIALGLDGNGFVRLFLNNKMLIQLGVLDQGFWPESLYTAPSDEALRYDIEITKRLGFNMVRKHVKVEADRWYYWCDRLGLLVWQDMPSGDRMIGPKAPDIERLPESSRQFEREWKAIMDSLMNHPSIVVWVPFNEGWGQFDTKRIVEWTKNYDPSRLVNGASGWGDRGVGDLNDIHVHPSPKAPAVEERRASVLGAFGGLGFAAPGHVWQERSNWGYRNYHTSQELARGYADLIAELIPLIWNQGVAAAVYTQTTDVEIEVNGLMTYDRESLKIEEAILVRENRKIFARPPSKPRMPQRLASHGALQQRMPIRAAR